MHSHEREIKTDLAHGSDWIATQVCDGGAAFAASKTRQWLEFGNAYRFLEAASGCHAFDWVIERNLKPRYLVSRWGGLSGRFSGLFCRPMEEC